MMGYNPAIDHQAVVEQARAVWAHLPPGAERGWHITNEAALRLAALGESAGLMAKSSGSNYQGYSIDRVCYREDGALYDCLYDGEGVAAPQWSYDGPIDPALWRPPVGQVEPEPPTPPDPPEPPSGECPCQAQLDDIKAELHALQALVLQEGAATRELVEMLRVETWKGGWGASLSNGWLTLKGTVGR